MSKKNAFLTGKVPFIKNRDILTGLDLTVKLSTSK